MEVITLKPFQSTYKNRGQAAEQVFRFNMTGEVQKADNRKNAPDFENVQIKTSRATICNGLFLVDWINENPAEVFAYVTKDLKFAYMMNKTEFHCFVVRFCTYDHDSRTHETKIRLKTEGNAMRAYLKENAKRA